MAKTKTNTHVCSNCFEEFLPKEIYISECVNNKTYSTLYCLDCISSLKIKEMIPYIKARVKKEKIKIKSDKPKTTKVKSVKKI